MKHKMVQVELTVPFLGKLVGEWHPDDAEANAAWELYVELVTRATVVELGPEEGLLREALTSFYSLFGSTRDILRRYGPEVAPVRKNGEITFGSVAVTMLNGVLRPLLAKWHPLLQAHESLRSGNTSPLDHERSWQRADELRQEIERTRLLLTDVARVLGRVCGAASLLPEDTLPPAPSARG